MPKKKEVAPKNLTDKEGNEIKKVTVPTVILCCEHCGSQLFSAKVKVWRDTLHAKSIDMEPLNDRVAERNRAGRRAYCPYCDNVTDPVLSI